MTIKVKLYGDLVEKAPQLGNNFGIPNNLIIETDEVKSVIDILNKCVITTDEISHIFVNGKYSGLGKEVKNGDRVGIFPKRMALIFLEIKSPF